MVDTVSIAGRMVGPGSPCFIIAEAGVNHNGSLEMALKLVDAALAAGADAVKFQTFRAWKVVAPSAPKADYQLERTGANGSQLEMAKRLELPFDAFRRVQRHCQESGILFLSTPFDEESADFLDGLQVPAFKIGSGEVTNLPFLAHVAGKGRPILLSTGMASLDEVAAALQTIRHHGHPPVALFHCVSNYPSNPADSNLAAMDTMREAFNVPTGWSDHTLGTHISVAAVALGADMIEKHFTLDRGLPGPDHAASLEPAELALMVRQVRDVESALGSGHKVGRPAEQNVAAVARRSLFAARNLPEGHPIDAQDLVALRPGTGIGPHRMGQIVGRRTVREIEQGTMLGEDDFE